MSNLEEDYSTTSSTTTTTLYPPEEENEIVNVSDKIDKKKVVKEAKKLLKELKKDRENGEKIEERITIWE